jgi:hypothetical protein
MLLIALRGLVLHLFSNLISMNILNSRKIYIIKRLLLHSAFKPIAMSDDIQEKWSADEEKRKQAVQTDDPWDDKDSSAVRVSVRAVLNAMHPRPFEYSHAPA